MLHYTSTQHYQMFIVQEARKCGEKGWQEYDLMFRQQKPSAMDLNWTSVNSSLYTVSFGPRLSCHRGQEKNTTLKMPGCVSGAKNQTTATLTALCLRLNHSSTPVMTEETHRESQVAVARAPLKGRQQSNAHVTPRRQSNSHVSPGRQSNTRVTPGIMDTANSN